MLTGACRPLRQDMVPFNVDFGNDASVLMRFQYVGSAVSGLIQVAATGDLAFEHGALGAEVADTTVNPNGDTPGTLDLTGGTLDSFATYKSIVDMVNLSANWVAWLVGARPDVAAFTTTTGHMTQVTDGICKVTGGKAITTDDSDSKYVVNGMTYKKDAAQIHFTDHQVVHELYQVIALSTYSSGTNTLLVYACDDDSGTSTLLYTFTAGATTVEVEYPTEGNPLPDIPFTLAKGKRLVVEMLNDTAALSVVRLSVTGWSYQIGIGHNPANLLSKF